MREQYNEVNNTKGSKFMKINKILNINKKKKKLAISMFLRNRTTIKQKISIRIARHGELNEEQEIPEKP